MIKSYRSLLVCTCTCVKNMRQDRNDAELMSITGTLQNILINYLEESSRKSMTVRPGSSVVTALPSNSLITLSYKVSTETTWHKSLQVSSASLVSQHKRNLQRVHNVFCWDVQQQETKQYQIRLTESTSCSKSLFLPRAGKSTPRPMQMPVSTGRARRGMRMRMFKQQ